MHPYLPHLIADIRAAHRSKTIHLTETPPASIEEELEEIEQWVTREVPEHTFGYYCGLETWQFPPAEQLSKKDIIQVCDAFREMLFSWNAGISLPDALPLPLQYQFTVNTLDEDFTVVNTGEIVFDFCSGDAPECPFREYCPCLKLCNDSGNFGEPSDSPT
jgi:hypothetical protein